MKLLGPLAHLFTAAAIIICLIGLALFSQAWMIVAIPVAIIAVLLLLALSFLSE